MPEDETPTETIEEAATETTETAGEAVETIKETVSDLAETVADTTVDIGETARDEIRDKLKTLEDAVSTLTSKVEALAPAHESAPAREDEDMEPASEMAEIETPRAYEPVHKTRPGPKYLHHSKRG